MNSSYSSSETDDLQQNTFNKKNYHHNHRQYEEIGDKRFCSNNYDKNNENVSVVSVFNNDNNQVGNEEENNDLLNKSNDNEKEINDNKENDNNDKDDDFNNFRSVFDEDVRPVNV